MEIIGAPWGGADPCCRGPWDAVWWRQSNDEEPA